MRRAAAVCALITLAAGNAAADPTEIHKVGIGVRAGGAPAPEGHVLFDWALDGTLRPWSFLGLGAELSGGQVSLVDGERSAAAVAPHLEVVHFTHPWLELFARSGLPMQSRSGGAVDPARGLAAYAAGGVRWWPDCHESESERQSACLTLGFELRALHVIDGGYLVMPAVLPDGASVVMSSITFGVEL